jgi:signal transduction histidine kinase
MDARTTGIGGTLGIESSPDRGTRIIAHVPRDPSVGETEDDPRA